MRGGASTEPARPSRPSPDPDLSHHCLTVDLPQSTRSNLTFPISVLNPVLNAYLDPTSPNLFSCILTQPVIP